MVSTGVLMMVADNTNNRTADATDEPNNTTSKHSNDSVSHNYSLLLIFLLKMAAHQS